jgi:hypothetical protein
MMTWADSRLTVEGIKGHPFFHGADWDSLRHIAPPFVPALRSNTDTAYFPTDDLGNVDQEPAETLGSDKDLAFLGYVHPSTTRMITMILYFVPGSHSNGSLLDNTLDTLTHRNCRLFSSLVAHAWI